MNKTTCPDHIADRYAEMEYVYMNENFVTVTLACDFCPNEWEIDAPADYKPNAASEILCESCADEWQWFEADPAEDRYLDSYWESLYE